ncbi:MAG: adenylate/guanylate cyclase domain-containing protein [Dehalococcoidia bacterium]|nr:adenylate/guanylate cyclase domain-containing protein [Dehalococcoidia bacterium]
MEPRIQYAQTADGVSIAFATRGEGMPLVVTPALLYSHFLAEGVIPGEKEWAERTAEKRMVVRYDHRGSGLSERHVTSLSLDTLLLDLEAVVDHLGLERFALNGAVNSGPVAIAYAARHSERVSHLALWCTYARNPQRWASPQQEAVFALLDKDWELFTETAAHVMLGWEEGELARRFAARIRESVTPEAYRAFSQARIQFDVSDLLPQVSCPALVMHRRLVTYPPLDLSRDLASRIPGARLIVFEGGGLAPFLGDAEAVAAALDEFLGDVEAPEATPAPAQPSGFRTILFTDVEGSTALTQRLGDAKAREVLREHERIVRECLATHGGSEVKTMGDGFMASFGSATRVLECAVAIQRAFQEWNAGAGAHGHAPLQIRIGLNAGEPIAEEEDLFGTAVIAAARIAGQASGGEILASDVVRQLVAGKGFLFSDRGDAVLRGFDDPVRLYEVRWRGEDEAD